MDVQKEVSAIARHTLGDLAPIAVAKGRDGSVEIRFDSPNVGIGVLWAGEGWPSEVRRAVGDVRKWNRAQVLVAKRLSPASLAWLREIGANWLDGAGLARIVSPTGLLVLREPSEQPVGNSRSEQSFSWTDVRKDVAEVLLAGRTVPRAAEIAESTGWSAVAVAKALSSFDASGWTAKTGALRGPRAQRHLASPQGLLDAWADAVATEKRDAILGHASFKDAVTFLNERLAAHLRKVGQWAASGWVGAQLIAPHVTSVPTLQLYVDPNTFDAHLLGLLASAEVRIVKEGARIEFWRARPVVLSETQVYPTPLVSIPRLYADLNRLGGRAVEAAQTVREQFLEY